MVTTRTAALSRSSSRLRSERRGELLVGRRDCNSQVLSDAKPSRSVVGDAVHQLRPGAAGRSPSVRRPPQRAAGRADPRLAATSSNIAASPHRSKTSAQPRICALSDATRASPPAASSSAVYASSGLRAASRTRSGRWGCSSAASIRCQAVAAAVVNTLDPPVSTHGTPARSSASQISDPWSRLRTSTAMSLDRNARRLPPSTICCPDVKGGDDVVGDVSGDTPPHRPNAGRIRIVTGDRAVQIPQPKRRPAGDAGLLDGRPSPDARRCRRCPAPHPRRAGPGRAPGPRRCAGSRSARPAGLRRPTASR